MSLEKNLDELERHISWAQSYYEDVRSDLEDELKKLAEYVTQLEEQNVLLEEQVGDITHEKVLLELELTEVTNELIQLRHELDISR